MGRVHRFSCAALLAFALATPAVADEPPAPPCAAGNHESLGRCCPDGQEWIPSCPCCFSVHELIKACDSAKTSTELSACLEAGASYGEGHGVPKDARRAADAFEKACRGNVAAGCMMLALQVEQGDGREANGVEAKRLFQQACDHGVGRSCYLLGIRLQEGRQGFAADRTSARGVLQTGCKTRYGLACWALAKDLEAGTTGKKDAAKAKEFTAAACQAGVGEACEAKASPTPPVKQK